VEQPSKAAPLDDDEIVDADPDIPDGSAFFIFSKENR